MKVNRPGKRHLSGLFLAICLTLGLFAAAAGEAGAVEFMGRSDSPYAIGVDRVGNVTTVYGRDEAGNYTVPVKTMLCSTGRVGSETPTGNYKLTRFKRLWLHMVDDSYGQYAVQFNGNYLFHSVCYAEKDPTTLLTHEYNDLGTSVSQGCVRLQTADAKWIFDNCPPGTPVTIYDGPDPDPAGKPGRLVDRIAPDDPKAGWDPTDPTEGNPWKAWLEELDREFSDVPKGSWYYDDVRFAYRMGWMDSVADGSFAPKAVLSRAMAMQMVQSLSGDALEAASQGEPWYLPALRWAVGNGVAEGVSEADFRPDRPITRQQLMVLLYRCETRRLGHAPDGGAVLAPYPDREEVDLFAEAAMGWAVSRGLLQGDGKGRLCPTADVTRAQAAAIFRRYYQSVMENQEKSAEKSKTPPKVS